MAEPLDDAEVTAWRERFPILGRCTYLINNSLGAMPAGVPASLQRFADEWATLGVEAWGTEWMPEVRRVADLLGSLMGAPAGSVVLHQNVATLTSIVASALDFAGERDGIVLAAPDWPSHGYLFAGYAARGARLDVVATDPYLADLEPLLAAIDDRTALVVVGHVLWRSAAIVDVTAVAARCREVGALCMVDGYHAIGHMPVDVSAIGCDFYVGGSVKWLCGGPGAGYLYVRPGLEQTLRPVAVGWLGHARPFGFEHDWEPAEGALGWLGGTPSIPAIASAREGYAAIAEVGPARIRATSERLTAHLVAGATERGVTIRTPLEPQRRAGAVALDLGDDTEAAARRLIDAGVIVDYRPGGTPPSTPGRPGAGDAGVIRVGAHFFNTAAELDQLLAALG